MRHFSLFTISHKFLFTRVEKKSVENCTNFIDDDVVKNEHEVCGLTLAKCGKQVCVCLLLDFWFLVACFFFPGSCFLLLGRGQEIKLDLADSHVVPVAGGVCILDRDRRRVIQDGHIFSGSHQMILLIVQSETWTRI